MIIRIKSANRNGEARQIAVNFLAMVVLRGVDLVTPLLTLPYLVKVLGIQKYGLINFSFSLALYFGSLIQYGFSVSATRDIARNRDYRQEVNKIFTTTLLISLLIATTCTLLVAAITTTFARFQGDISLYLMSFAFIALQSLFPTWLFQGLEKMKQVTYISLAVKIATVVGIFLIIHEENDYIYVPAINTTGAILALALSLWLVRYNLNIRFTRIKIDDLCKGLVSGRHAFISQVMPTLYNNSSTFILGLYAGNGAVGIFSSATRLIDASTSIGYVISNAFFPYLSRKLDGHKIFARLMFALSLLISGCLLVSSDWITSILFKENSAEISKIINYLSPTPILLFLIMTYGTNYLMLNGNDKIVKQISFYSSIAFLAIGWFLIQKFGIFGAVFTLLGARLTMAGSCYFAYKKLSPKKNEKI